jgi:hypothetical protein
MINSAFNVTVRPLSDNALTKQRVAEERAKENGNTSGVFCHLPKNKILGRTQRLH